MIAALERIDHANKFIPLISDRVAIEYGPHHVYSTTSIQIPHERHRRGEVGHLILDRGRYAYLPASRSKDSRELRDGDMVAIGSHLFIFRQPDVAFSELPDLPWGQFRYEFVIARGGMANVFKAKHPVYGDVAVKIPREPQWSADILAEGSIGLRCNHPRILRPHFTGILPNGVSGLVMPLIQSGDLGSRARADKLNDLNGRALIDDLLSALEYLHSLGILHCDVKPSNILVANGRYMLCDFGIACVPGQTSTRGWLSHGFASPEHIDGKKLRPSADLYMLGRTLAEVLSSSSPQLQTWVRSLTNPEAGKRPQSVTEARVLLPS